jgi:hypothetical protein
VAVAVVGGALIAVFEDFVGFVDLFELDLALRIARIAVRVPFHRELAERAFQRRIVGVALDFEGFVVATLGSGHPSNLLEFDPLGSGCLQLSCR